MSGQKSEMCGVFLTFKTINQGGRQTWNDPEHKGLAVQSRN